MFATTDENKVENNVFEAKKQPNKCRDPLFAVLFYVNLVAITGIAATLGTSALDDVTNQDDIAVDDGSSTETPSISPFVTVAVYSGGLGLVLSCAALQILMMIPGILIKVALIGNIVLCGLAALAALFYGIIGVAVIALLILLLTCCWTYCIWSRIPFATANLKTGCSAVRANCGVTILAYVVSFLTFGWLIVWSLAFFGINDSLTTCEVVNGENVCTSGLNYFYLFFLFVSVFFTEQVLQNTVHTTVAGVVGTWWFVPDENGFCGSAVLGSFWRTITTSFGSVCFGSLIVAVIQAIRQIVETAKQNDDIGNALACCIDCILGCIESLVEYFNKWAYVYVGLYGFGYCEAGKNVMQLFKDRGWEAIIADDIISTVLGLMGLVVGLITAGFSVLIASQSDMFDEFAAFVENGDTIAQIVCGIVGFIIGMFLCSIVMGVISSSVFASIVLFAEAPAEFESNHPEHSREMREAYQEAHPGCM